MQDEPRKSSFLTPCGARLDQIALRSPGCRRGIRRDACRWRGCRRPSRRRGTRTPACWRRASASTSAWRRRSTRFMRDGRISHRSLETPHQRASRPCRGGRRRRFACRSADRSSAACWRLSPGAAAAPRARGEARLLQRILCFARSRSWPPCRDQRRRSSCCGFQPSLLRALVGSPRS